MNIKELKSEINKANEMYYKESTSIMSDEEFDAKMKILAKAGEEPEICSDVKNDNANKFKHLVPMLSIKNAYDKETLEKWVSNVVKKIGHTNLFICSKIDGVSGALNYEDGKLINASTRGNGIEGESVFNNAMSIGNIPKAIGSKLETEIVGEFYISKKDFEEINKAELKISLETGKKQVVYSNPRNLVSGTIKNTHPELCKSRNVRFIVHSMGNSTGSLSETLIELESNGFEVVKGLKANTARLEDLWDKINKIKNISESSDYESDGVVVSVDSYKDRCKLGASSKYPAWAIACKFYNDDVETIIRDIEYSVGKNGSITPVAIFDKVFLLGSFIQRASISNKSVMESLDLHEGDSILVEKAGKIIPKIKKVLVEKRICGAKKFEFPETCPVCNNKLYNEQGRKKVFCFNCAKENNDETQRSNKEKK